MKYIGTQVKIGGLFCILTIFSGIKGTAIQYLLSGNFLSNLFFFKIYRCSDYYYR